MRFPPDAEWLEADGLGGFASGTVSGIRTRRYHALLLAATTPPTGRMVLVNGLDAELETGAGKFALSSQRYPPDVVHPDGAGSLESFELEPWPRWIYCLADGARIEQQLFVPASQPLAALSWRLLSRRKRASLTVRLFLSGRDSHSLQRENASFRFDAEVRGGLVSWRPYDGVPGVVAHGNGAYTHRPQWYRNFLYAEEQSRGLDCVEDLAAPGAFEFDLSSGEAILLLTTEDQGRAQKKRPVVAWLASLRAAERKRRGAFASRLERAADAYIVRRGNGRTIMAGYPWFTDWGRDTFVALRGLCLGTGRLEDARLILVEWAGAVSRGMLPNCFAEAGGVPEFNSADASLWYVIAVHEYLEAAARARRPAAEGDRRAMAEAVEAILEGYAAGVRYGIHMDPDGLMATGEPGVQLTWMDAKQGEWVVTPRTGKPVEIQALWLNALTLAARANGRWKEPLARGRASFEARFWNEAGGCLYDVVDVDHRPGTADPTFRPNQLFAVGGLPVPILEGVRARKVVDACEARLLTPLGPRSLAPGEPGYAAHYRGGVRERDGAYHQGTVWPWLMGPFVEAWLRVRRNSAAARREAKARFLKPLLQHLDTAGLGHISEIADAEPPFTPRGCPFQAWSAGEAIRIQNMLSTPAPARKAKRL